MLTPERLKRIKDTASRRQVDITVLFENVHDPHNISAVLRTCDSIGIGEVYVLCTDGTVKPEKYSLGHQSSSGARKWVDVQFYTDRDACYKKLKEKYKHIVGTHLGKEAVSIHSYDFCSSMAIVFGNERDGITNDSLKYLDANIFIPQVGMVKSLNISVACAVTLYEAMRQRSKSGMYDGSEKGLAQYEADYVQRHVGKYKGTQPTIN